MVKLMRIAPELRDLILEEVLFSPEREPPASPSASLDRRKRKYCENSCCCDGHDIYVQCEGFLPTTVRTPPVLLVNRQLHEEASYILAKKKQHYRLDIMYVKQCGLWPTWLSVPRLSHHAESVHVQFRVFDPPPRVDPDWHNERQYLGGDSGPPFIVWNLFALLKDYLRYGPTAFEGLVAQPSVFTVGRIVINVVPPPEDTKDDNLGFPPRRPGSVMLEAFARGKASRTWPIPPQDRPHLMVAEKMGFFVARHIGILLSRYEEYGKLLYERIGSIDIRVGGESRRLFDLDELLDLLPTRPILAHNAEETARQQEQFGEWKGRTAAARKGWRAAGHR